MAGLNRDDRFIITSDDKAGLLVIVTAIGLSWTILTLVIRIVSKLHIKRSLGVEELLVIAASSLAFVTSCCLLVAVKYGFGRKGVLAGSPAEETILKLLWTSDIFYILTLGIAKSATLPLLMQLTPIKGFVTASRVIAVLICTWCIISVFLIAFRCDAISPWNDATTTQCASVFPRWASIEILSIVIEVLIFGLFLVIIHILRMRMKAKVKVVLAFSTRLTVIIPTIFRLVYLEKDLQRAEPTFSLIYAMITAQAVLHYTTMAASFAYLKPFLRAFDSNLGATVKVDTVVSTGYPNNSRSHEQSSKDRDRRKRESKSFAVAVKSSDIEEEFHDQSLQEDRPRLNKVDSSSRAQSPHLTTASGETSKFSINHKRVSHRKQESGDSITPIIRKTQEWHVRTEPRDEDLHAM